MSLTDCKAGNHALREIHRSYSAHVDESVKWCIECGAVVVDQEVDGRVFPGKSRKMEWPKALEKVKF